MGSELQPWIEAIAEKLKLVSIIADNQIQVLAHAPGNIGYQIAEALDSGTGIVAIVGFGKIGRPARQSLRRVYDPLRFFVRVAENALLNDQAHVLEVAERIDAELGVYFDEADKMRPWRPDLEGADFIYPDGDMEQLTIVPRAGDEPDEKAIYDGWDVPFRTKFSPLPAQVPA